MRSAPRASSARAWARRGPLPTCRRPPRRRASTPCPWNGTSRAARSCSRTATGGSARWASTSRCRPRTAARARSRSARSACRRRAATRSACTPRRSRAAQARAARKSTAFGFLAYVGLSNKQTSRGASLATDGATYARAWAQNPDFRRLVEAAPTRERRIQLLCLGMQWRVGNPLVLHPGVVDDALAALLGGRFRATTRCCGLRPGVAGQRAARRGSRVFASEWIVD